MTRKEFERIVQQSLNQLPRDLRCQIANVAIVVKELPDDETLDAAGVDNPYDLFGFYRGIPLTERAHDYGLVLPDKTRLGRA